MYATSRKILHLTRAIPALLVAWVLGSYLQLQQSELWPWQIYAALLLLGVLGLAGLCLRALARRGWWVAWLLLAMVAAVGLTGLRAGVFLQAALSPDLEGRDLLVTGVVSALPQRNEAGLRFRMEVETALLAGEPARVPPRMDVGWYGGAFSAGPAVLALAEDRGGAGAVGAPPVAAEVSLNRVPADVRAGERWQMNLRFKAPHGSRNPHGFDYELWLWEQGVQATGYVRASAKDPVALRLGQTWRYPVALARQTVREQIFARVTQRQFAGLVAALVVGDQNAIERPDWDVFRATGVAHLVSISGLHITMFAWGAALLVGTLWRRSFRLCLALPAPTAALLGGLLLASLYAVFSGWGVPAQRTCLMLATVAVLRISGVRWPWPQRWLLACAVVVASDPWALLQAGFWLSFVAVGVLFASDRARDRHADGAAHLRLGGRPLQNMLASAGAMWREQWVITVALTPLTLLLFGQISWVGLLANTLAIPWVTLVVTPLAFLGLLFAPLWDICASALGLLLMYLHWLADLPGASIAFAVPPIWVGVAGVLGGLVLVMPLPWTMRQLGVLLLLPLMVWRQPLPPEGQFELLAADIGQGNAVLVRTARHALLFDTGPRYNLESDAGNRVLVPLLQALNTRLDTLVLSHRDTDHVGGARSVLAMQPQAEVLSSLEVDHLLQPARNTSRCLAGQRWVWDEVAFEVLHPLSGDYNLGLRPNALSCVLRIAAATQSALLVGDIEQPQELRLVASGVALASTVLLVPHHGSKTSSSAEFLQAVAPRWAIVQSGYRNRFGHPGEAVVDRYRAYGIALLDSPHCGAFSWRSWQADMHQNEACYRVRSRRYWHHEVPHLPPN
ncbi:MAG: DNA internalization-related competence protein ComEC/Rec2 [Rhodoferax sp.]|nr:DNA internalization-related competence protein ComEC/Rec2 [Rhodoferax sp.]